MSLCRGGTNGGYDIGLGVPRPRDDHIIIRVYPYRWAKTIAPGDIQSEGYRYNRAHHVWDCIGQWTFSNGFVPLESNPMKKGN